MDELLARDPKGIYNRYQRGEIRDVAGMDIEFPRPDKADLVIRNEGSRDDLVGYARAIADRITGRNV